MDIARKTRRLSSRTWVIAVAGVATLAVAAGVASAAAHGGAATATADKTSLWVGTVRRDSLRRTVQAHGTLIPEEVRWVSAVSTGRVESIAYKPGAEVDADAVIVTLGNPEIELAALEAERQVKRSEVALAALGATLTSQRLTLSSQVAAERIEVAAAAARASTFRKLGGERLAGAIEVSDETKKAEGVSAQLGFDEQRLRAVNSTDGGQLAAQRGELEQLRKIAAYRRRQVDELAVRAGATGTLQEMPLEVGQWVTVGALIAKVARPGALKAELRVAEVQAKEVVRGRGVLVDTRTGDVRGHVTRVDPAVQNGTVRLEVALDGPAPAGARPDLAVDARIELETVDDVLVMPRPAFANEGARSSLFRLSADGNEAARTDVTFGRASVDTVEIAGGLREGDRVVLSDTSMWENDARLRLR